MTEEKSLDLRPAEKLRNFFNENLNKMATVLPKHIDSKRYMTIALSAIWKNETLMQCNAYTLFKAVMDLAELGLEVGSYRGQACILPYFNKKKNCYEAQAQVMYQGLIDLCARSGEVIDIRARIVREKDQFEVEYGLEEKLIHKPYFGEDAGAKTHVYAVIRYKDGTKAFEVMTAEQVLKIKAKSQAVQKGWMTPWTDEVGEDEMWKKTVIKRLLKVVPKEIEKVREVINKDEELEFGAIRQSISAQLEAKTEKATQALAEKLEKPVEPPDEPRKEGDSATVLDGVNIEKCPDCGYAKSVCSCKNVVVKDDDQIDFTKKPFPKREGKK